MTHLTYLEAAVVGLVQASPRCFLLATPVILAAGVLKLPDLFGSGSHGIRGPILTGSIIAGVSAYLSVRFLLRYLRTRTLTPFGIYCLLAGVGSFVYLGLIKWDAPGRKQARP